MTSSLRSRALEHVKRIQDVLDQGMDLDVKSLRAEISSLRHLLDTANSVDLSGLYLEKWRNRPRPVYTREIAAASSGNSSASAASVSAPLLIVKYGPPGSGKSTEAILRPLYRYILGPDRKSVV